MTQRPRNLALGAESIQPGASFGLSDPARLAASSRSMLSDVRGCARSFAPFRDANVTQPPLFAVTQTESPTPGGGL